MTHQIYFELDQNLAISVISTIMEDMEQLPIMHANSGEIGFYLELNKDEAEYFAEQYDRYITTICDLDQEKGGSYI